MCEAFLSMYFGPVVVNRNDVLMCEFWLEVNAVSICEDFQPKTAVRSFILSMAKILAVGKYSECCNVAMILDMM